MALTTEQIDAEAFARWGDMKGAPLAMCRGFARAIEAEARRDALEEAEKVCDQMHEEDRPGDYAYAIRALKESPPPTA